MSCSAFYLSFSATHANASQMIVEDSEKWGLSYIVSPPAFISLGNEYTVGVVVNQTVKSPGIILLNPQQLSAFVRYMTQ